MRIQLNQINKLPQPTWVSLKVNGTSVDITLPEKGNVLRDVNVKNARLGAESTAFAQNFGGSGGEYADFAHQNADGLNDFTVDENTPDAVINLTQKAGAESAVTVNRVHAKAGATVSVCAQYLSDGQAKGAAVALNCITAEKGAAVKFIEVQTMSRGSTFMSDFAVRCEEGASVEIVRVLLGAGRVYLGAKSSLVGRQSESDIKTAYLALGREKYDLNFVAEHIGKESVSDTNVYGAMSGSAVKLFRGTIDFKRGAAHATGKESENTLLFSPDAHSQTVPLILCAEEDVEGAHAATIGKIDQSKLFYMTSRGLSEGQAKKLIAEAQFIPVLDKIDDKKLSGKIKSYVARKLEKL